MMMMMMMMYDDDDDDDQQSLDWNYKGMKLLINGDDYFEINCKHFETMPKYIIITFAHQG